MSVPRLHVITPVVPVDRLRALVAAGADAVQLRDKSLDDRSLLAFARAAVEALRPTHATVIVNDRLDIALAAGAGGVHLGQGDLPVAAARSLAPGLLIGGTCRSRAQALEARDAGASYVGVGPVFTTASKDGLPDPLGLDGLAATTGVLPVIAIAGITADRVPAVLAVGAHGVAVLGAISHAPDPPRATKELASALAAA